MKQLPSGYTAVNGLGARMGYYTDGIYIDTGVVPTSTMNVTALFYTFYNAYEYLFGARNSNSNSSAGQLNFLNGSGDSGTGASYIGYQSARISVSNGLGSYVLISNVANEFTVNSAYKIIEKTGSATSFTGTRNIYILALNNGGTANFGTYLSARVFGFKIEDGGSVIRDYAPAYDETAQKYGLYDFANDTFTAIQGIGILGNYNRLTITHTEGGQAYASTYNSGNVTEIIAQRGANTKFSKVGTDILASGTNLIAVADKGYVFAGWEINGQIETSDEETYLNIDADTTVNAVFIKEQELDSKLGYTLLGLEYGFDDLTDNLPYARHNYFTKVISASVSQDGTSSTTTTIVCKDIPSVFINNMPVFLMNPKGKVVYCGVIKSINDNTITCREPISVFDNDYILYSETPTHSIIYYLYQQMNHFRLGHLDSQDKGQDISVSRMMKEFRLNYDHRVPFDVSKAINVTAPATSNTESINLESYIFDQFNNFGVYVLPYLDWIYRADADTDNGQGRKYLMFLTVMNPRTYDTIELGDNLECLSNITVDVQEQETTVLNIYNSSGSTFRGCYSVKNDGTITELVQPISNYICETSCKPKVVMSDDKINVLLEQYLSSAKYNHKIEFDISFDNSLLPLDAFKMGRRVDFYHKNKVYNSIVTAVSFNVLENTDEIKSAKITLGKVRNKLTIKLNLSKKK